MNKKIKIIKFLLPMLIAWNGLVSANDVSPHDGQADQALIVKSERKLYFYKADKVLQSFDIALGLMPEGPKERSGDFRTPEGHYYLETKNPNSNYFLSIKISYPNAQDIARAREQGIDPGGQIMIHGQPNEAGYSALRAQGLDWTDGCIAVSNSDMVDIWLMTEGPIPIEIRP